MQINIEIDNTRTANKYIKKSREYKRRNGKRRLLKT